MEFSGSDTSQPVVAARNTPHNREFSPDSVTRHLIVYHPIGCRKYQYVSSWWIYHPITIGDHLHDRYQIVHKLGFGDRSTVWLAWDNSYNVLVDMLPSKLPSLKLTRKRASSYTIYLQIDCRLSSLQYLMSSLLPDQMANINALSHHLQGLA